MKGGIDPYFAEMLERYATCIREGAVEKICVDMAPYFDVDSKGNEVVTRRVTVILEFQEAPVSAG